MPNPMSRNYESNGPDVKVRGNAAHIAEKYTTLARDAFSSGDTVMGENYLQHAEHYNRIVAAAQAQAQPFRSDDQPSGGFGNSPQGRIPQPDGGPYGDGDEDNADGFGAQDSDNGIDDNPRSGYAVEGGQMTQPQGGTNQGNNQGNGQGDFGGRHHRNRRRPRFGDNGRDDRDRQPRGGQQGPTQANGSGETVNAEGGDERRSNANQASAGQANVGQSSVSQSNVSPDASMLPRSILGGAPAPENGSDD